MQPLTKSALSEFRCEGINDALDKAGKLDEQFHKRLRLDDLRLAERYVKSELQFLIHFRIGGIDQEFVAYLQREKDIGWPEEHVDNGNDLAFERRVHGVPEFLHRSLHISSDVKALKHRSHREQQTVFFDIVKTIERPEDIIPTFVWFDCVDGVYGRLSRSLYLSQLFGFVFRGVVLDREIQDRSARTRLISAYFKLGRKADAEKVLTDALKRNPKDTELVCSTLGQAIDEAKRTVLESDKTIMLQADACARNLNQVRTKYRCWIDERGTFNELALA